MALIQITAIHPLFLSLIFFYIDLATSRPTLHLSERIRPARIGQVQDSLDARGGTALSVNDKLAISLSIGVGGLLLIFGIVCFIGYNKRRRRCLHQDSSNEDNPLESMQTLPHHPLYKECLHSTNTNQATTSPNTTNTLDSSPFLYNPYIPSPITSYFQPGDVYRTLVNANDANGVTGRRPGYISPPPNNPLILNPTRPRVSQSFSEPPSPKTVLKPREDAISPVIRSTTIPIYSPQPRRGIGLPLGARQRMEAGLGVTYPPQAMVRERPF